MPVGESSVDAIVGMIRQGRIQEARITLKETIRNQPEWAAKWYLFARLLMEGTEREQRLRQTEDTEPEPSVAGSNRETTEKRFSTQKVARLETFLANVREMRRETHPKATTGRVDHARSTGGEREEMTPENPGLHHVIEKLERFRVQLTANGEDRA